MANSREMDGGRTTGRSSKIDASRLADLLGGWAEGQGPLYLRLANGIEALVAEGALRDGQQLPPERSLATTLSVSRSTVVSAYERLRDANKLERVQGSGTTVRAAQAGDPHPEPLRSTVLFGRSETLALLQAVPAPSIDVGAELALLSSTLENLTTERPEMDPKLLTNVEPAGWWGLRESLATRYTTDGLETAPNNILITNGAQQALSLLLAHLCQPGDVVLCEEFTWPGLTDAVEQRGARCVGIPIDDDGLMVPELRAAIERLRPTAVIVNPHHHNPTGTRMLPHRRRELADLAAEYRVVVVEDRVFASVSFDGVVPPPIASHRPDAPIITIDSMSKTVWGGIRLGWLRGSTDMIGPLRFIKALDDLGTSLPSQLLGYQLLPRLDELLVARSNRLHQRAELAVEQLSQAFPDWTVQKPSGGASLWTRLPGSVATPFVHHAARQGVLVIGGSSFAVPGSHTDPDGGESRLRIPFTATPDEFSNAIDRLATAWETFDPARSPALTQERATYV